MKKQTILVGFLAAAFVFVAAGASFAGDRRLPELPVAGLSNDELGDAVEVIRQGLQAGLAGQTRQLVRLPYVVPDHVPPLAATAAVAEVEGEDQIAPAAQVD